MANPLLNLITGYNELREQEGKTTETKGSKESKETGTDTKDTDQQAVDEKEVENLSVEEKIEVLAQAVADLTEMMKEAKGEKEGAE